MKKNNYDNLIKEVLSKILLYIHNNDSNNKNIFISDTKE